MGKGVECAEWCASVEQQCEGRLKVHNSHVRHIVLVWAYIQTTGPVNRCMSQRGTSHIVKQNKRTTKHFKVLDQSYTKESKKNILKEKNEHNCLPDKLFSRHDTTIAPFPNTHTRKSWALLVAAFGAMTIVYVTPKSFHPPHQLYRTMRGLHPTHTQKKGATA